VFPVGPISIVPLHQHDGFSYFTNFFWQAKSHKLAKTGICLFIAMGHSHPATNKNVKTSEATGPFVFDCDEANVVSIDICIIHRRHSNGDFEPKN
jgi:hypothetical protein